jgi:NAD+ synthase
MDTNYSKIESKLISFLQEEVSKIGFERVVLGLSGGVDSAVVAVLCKKAFGPNMLAVMIPSDTTNPIHMSHALSLCEKFDIEAEHVSIKNMLHSYPLELKTKLRKGNLAARLRMSVLYDISARDKAIVVGTSNKSEIILGYGTMYGDTACGINPIGSLYKTQIFGLAKHIGVTEEIILKAPSADLWEGQSDEEELGFKYKDLDAAMFELFEGGLSKEEVVKNGHSAEMVEFIMARYEANVFKSKPPKIASL